MPGFDIVWILKSVPAVIIGLTVHEFAHAWMAWRLGDTTAKDSGRLTLNPVKHIDPLGFLLIVIAGFGWAKPVMFNPQNLKNRHRDEILISLAGPFSNLLTGVLFFLLARLLYVFPFFRGTPLGSESVNLLLVWGLMNFGLFVFNLLPIPPLDGSHLYLTFLGTINAKLMNTIYRFGTYGLLIIILIDNRTDARLLPISPVIGVISDYLIHLLRF